MSNKNENNKIPTVTIIIVIIAILGLGYFLVTTSPKTLSQKTSSQTKAGDNMHGSPGAPNTAALNDLVGNSLPALSLTDKDGKTYTAADFKDKYTVLFFNEGLMCYPACWNQMAAFGSDQRFNSGDVQAISVVTDSATDWQKAINKMPELAKATTLFDTDKVASRQLAILDTESSMHRGMLPGHTYILIDKNGVVRYVFDDPNMALANDMLWNKIQELNK